VNLVVGGVQGALEETSPELTAELYNLILVNMKKL